MFLTSDEWYLALPVHGEIVGDRLVIEEGTDIDSLVMQWGQIVPPALAQQSS
jgi:hypothetical protein